MGIVSDQVILFCLLGAIFAMFVWGKVRYDLVAFGGLVLAVVIGVVPGEQAFSGFGHQATVIIALVLIVSRGLSNSGAIELVARHVVDAGRSLFGHISLMACVSAAMSAVMNNVAALALLMPIDIQAAKKAKRSAALTLMPLSFASILGGMITLIGTPPNIIIASFREKAVGEPFGMFDFTPVGLVTASAGIAFIVLLGWRLIPVPEGGKEGDTSRFNVEDYVAEVRVGENRMTWRSSVSCETANGFPGARATRKFARAI
jgi:di/tricarboxylate transporter